ncbi:hypothetical protein [Almyronema epifaneia]|uniref:Uncharacterized protein n=1 Tax=Almyronema epifaneia S1 TaxID=2991925 RepID=A0ABW6IIV1_9CYAN
MEEWSKQFWQSIEEIAHETSQFLEAITQQATTSAAEWSEALVEQVEQVEQAIAPELESWLLQLEQMMVPLENRLTPELEAMAEQVNATLEPLLATLFVDLTEWTEQISTPVAQTVDPFLQQHSACVGCRNYHGQVYSGELLVCAIYPYGPDQEKCPDWESAWGAS